MTTSDEAKTRSARVAEDVAALLRARNPLIWVVTREEARAERYLFEAAAAAGYTARTWDVSQGLMSLANTVVPGGSPDPDETLALIRRRADGEVAPDTRQPERCVYIMRDLPPFLTGAVNARTCRALRNLARFLPSVARDRAQVVVVLTPSAEVPLELTGHATVIEWPLPDREEIGGFLDALVAALPETDQAGNPFRANALRSGRDAAVDAAVGLSGEEAQACFASSLVKLRRIDPPTVAQEKKRAIARERVLEWYDPLSGGLSAVGGLDALKAWLTTRATAYTTAAREYGLPRPKGVLLVGVQGCGKSLSAKAIATAWGVPLLRLDLGSLRSKYVGESEGQLRRAIRVVESVGRCVLWLDEIEKALQGATSGSADGGVSADALGTILTWMQERTSDAFVIATANEVESLPPELLRKGRFDEIFFVDAPNAEERLAILNATFASYKKSTRGVDLKLVAGKCEGFVGSEVAALVPEAMFEAYGDGARAIKTKDLVNAASRVVPLTTTAKEKIDKLRQWASERARPATMPLEVTTRNGGSARQLDI